MKRLLIILLLIWSIPSFSTTYQIGSDATYHQWAELPALSPGDHVQLKRGEIFNPFTIGYSGTDGSHIVIEAYGTGANPIISGFTPVTVWTNLGSNIWESTNAVSTLSSLKMVTINGVNTAMGRTPNTGSYYTVTSHNANVSLTSSNLSGTPDWTGAMAVIRKERWAWQRATITSQSGGTILYIDESTSSYTPRDGWGFFIQNDSRTLDTQNEWYYNPSTKKIRIYSTSQPINVKVASTATLLTCNTKNYITISGIDFTGSNDFMIDIRNSTNIEIQNCTFSFGGSTGLYFNNVDNSSVSGCAISEMNDIGMSAVATCDNFTITNNYFTNNSMLPGMMGLFPNTLSVTATNSVVQYNSFDYSGYNGIFVKSATAQIRNNLINHSCMVLDDGGGIYTNDNQASLVIDHNIVLNSYGYSLGTTDAVGSSMSMGIYLDRLSEGITVSNNTVAGCGSNGILVSRATGNTITGNTCFDNGSQFNVSDGSMNETSANVVTSNIFVAKTIDQYVAYYFSSTNNIASFFTTIDNNIYSRPIDDNLTIFYYQPNNSYDAKSLATWKSFSGKDANSTKSPVSVSSESDIVFLYNATAVVTYPQLPFACVDMTGNKKTGFMTLQPYTSFTGLKDPNPAPTLEIDRIPMVNGQPRWANGRLVVIKK